MTLSDEFNSELNELLKQPTAEEAKYVPRFEFDGTTGTLQTGPMPAEDGFDFEETLRRFGKDPAKYQVAGEPQESIWEQRARNRETNEFETTLLHAWKARFALRNPVASSADIEALVLKAKKRHSDVKPSGGYWFVFQAGDQQLGKRSSGGSTEQIVERYVESIENAKAELKQLKRHGIAGIQVSMPGDCLEGVVSQGSKNMWLTQETITEQVRILRRLMFHTVQELAPLTSELKFDVVNGNHDQSQRIQNTYPGDGWATESAIAVSDALKLNESAFGHVEVRVPPKWQGYMTVPVGDTIVTVIHGHQWRNGQAFKWWSGQALNSQPAGASQLLQNGHFHSFEIETNAQRTRVASPTYDMGSDWYTEKTGATSKRGGLVYLLKSGEVSRLSLV
jgi:hypothetical protein